MTDNVNINQTCNAYWDGGGSTGTVNFYRSGGGCRNTGEIAAVFLHEWGHGIDQNDGGGYDNPSEAYADITSFVLTHASCIGRGFTTSNCTGYGNACLNCTGVRDADWNQRANHAPQTPENWPASCPSGTGPCSKEVHCEAYLAAETLWDLAVRDLPAAGVDQQTAWQLVDRMWFKSRQGSGGNAYSCGSPASNRSCAATTWFTKLRTVDDDDGNLANGTPHAAQIFSAFNRHNIPCGASTDAANLNTSSCPALVAPTVTASGSPGAIALSWPAVPNAASYNVLRNDQGCNWGYTIIATVTGTSYTDTNLPNSFPLYYAVQPVGSNAACLGALSSCTTAQAGGPHAAYSSTARVADTCGSGGTGNNDGVYDAGEQIQFSVTLRNDGAAALTGVSATLTPVTAGVTMVNGTASYGSLAVGASGTSASPHYTALLPAILACGSTVSYNISITANEGSWTGSFTQTVGQPLTGGGTVLSESFSGGIPGTWSVVDGGSGGGAAATWTTANPGARTFASPIASPAVIVDSDNAGSTATQDEQLITPVLNLSSATAVTLAYDEYFRWYNGSLDEKGDVDVKSSLTGGAWVNVVRNQGAATSNPNHRTVDITAQAAGASNVQLRFRYYSAQYEWYWQVDNVVVTWTGPAGCTMHACTGPVCGNGTLEAGEQCDDGNTQNGDCCNSACQYEAAGSSCGSATSNTCTSPDTCNAAGQCQANNVPNGTACSDGNACTQTDTCQAGACTGANPVVCTAQDQCHTAGTCNPATGACSNPAKPDGTACSDGNACTQTDTCQSGACTGANPVICTALDQCHDAGACNPATGACTNPAKPDGTACSDGNACTQTDTCQAGACTGANPVICTAQDQCHDAGACNPATGACTNPAKPDGTACSDGNACTQTDTCQSGACAGANPVACTALDQCHDAGACNPATGACTNPAKPDGTACSDGNACTQTDTCQSGACAGANPVVCTALDQCHDAGTCNPATGACSNPAKPDGTACSDGNACTQTDTCQSGACAGANPVVCTALDQCHDAGACNPATGACSNPAKPDGTA